MKRSGAAVNVYDGKIYVAGGHDGPLIHNSVEVYDPHKNKWSLTTQMNTCRRNAGLFLNFNKDLLEEIDNWLIFILFDMNFITKILNLNNFWRWFFMDPKQIV